MELEHARALLAELADGVDPLTGECLPSDSVCNRPEIIRALHCVLQHTAGANRPSAIMPTKYARMMTTSKTFKSFTPPERDLRGAAPQRPDADYG